MQLKFILDLDVRSFDYSISSDRMTEYHPHRVPGSNNVHTCKECFTINEGPLYCVKIRRHVKKT